MLLNASEYKSFSLLKKTLMVFSFIAFIISAIIGIGSIFIEKNSVSSTIADHEKRLISLEAYQEKNSKLLLEIKYNLRQYFLQRKLDYVELK